MRRQTLVVMVKEPRVGRVKTRLGREMGMVAATWWFRHQVKRLLREVDDPRWQVVLAVSPDVEGLESRVWPAKFLRVAQGRGALGTRMARLLCDMPKGPVVLIGGDIPGIRRQHITAAFAELGGNRVVFGPATDGGYWLVGLKRTSPPPRGMFAGVRWSTKHALADTLATMPDYAPAVVATLQDVDTVADLAKIAP